MLDSCKIVQKQSEAFHTFLWQFYQVENTILLHIVILIYTHVQILFLEFSCCDNQALLGCIPIPADALPLVSHLIRYIARTYWISKSLR